jgi:hypothetical protein
MSARVMSVLLRPLALAALLTGTLVRSVPGELQMFVAVSAQEPSPAAPGPQVEAGLVRMKTRAVQSGGAPGNLTYHGGPVQHTQKIFTIFWDTGSSLPSGYQTTINQFVQDLSGSPYYAIGSQYGDTTGGISTALSFGGTWHDATNAFPEINLTFDDLLAEVNRAKAANGWTSDSDSYFQVYTPSGIASTIGGICGLHWFANPAIGQILFPQFGCFPGSPYPNNSIVDTAINVSAHEIMESVTDPLGNAWYFVNTGGEIGDVCNFNFGARAGDGSNVTLNGHQYVVQQEWSNAVSGCALSYIPPSATITANGQTGPLILPSGSALQLAIAADGGTPGFANPSDLYMGVSSPFGVFWITSLGFSPTIGAIYHGPLPSFGPAPLLSIPDVSVLPLGNYVWFMVVTGASGTVFDTVQTDIP